MGRSKSPKSSALCSSSLVHVEVRGQRATFRIWFFPPTGSGGQTQVTRLGHKCLYPLSHLSDLPSFDTDSQACLYLFQALAKMAPAEWAWCWVGLYRSLSGRWDHFH